MGKESIGTFEEMVMLTVALLRDDAYGVAIQEELESRLKKSVSIGAMRTSLKRLEKKGFLTSEFGEATSVRGGKRKRYYQVTPYGKQVLEEMMSTRSKMWAEISTMSFDLKFS
jgi:DNA-binding PadR family transcriptional regulator